MFHSTHTYRTSIIPTKATKNKNKIKTLLRVKKALISETTSMAFKAEVWVEAVMEGGRRFMAAWREEEEDAARHHQEKREATRLGKLQSHTEA